MRRIGFVARKEVYHILRDPRSLMIVFAMPVLMVLLYGYAINMDIENVTIAVVDFDKSAESRDITERLYSSTYFSRPDNPVDMQDPDATLRSGDASAIAYIPPGFGKSLARGEKVEIGLTVDGSDASLAAAVQNYTSTVVRMYVRDRMPEGHTQPGIQVSFQVLYNPDLESAHFFVPGLVAVILIMISALLTSITIAREKETGTMEQLLTTPVRSYEILLGKLLPYTALAFIDGVLVVVSARIVFGVPFVGSYIMLIVFGMVYVITSLCIGIVISSIVKTQQVAMMLALVTTMLPSIMLSGFIFAIKNMPPPLQVVSHIVPATYFIKIIRGIMLKGAGLDVLAVQAGWLVLLALVLLTIATRKFETRIG